MKSILESIVAVVFLIAFFRLAYVSIIAEHHKAAEASRLWAAARDCGMCLGDFPHVSITRGRVCFTLESFRGRGGAIGYAQLYVARGITPSTALSSDVGKSLLAAAHARNVYCQVIGDELVARCDGVPTPEEARERLAAFEAVAGLLMPRED